MQSLIFETAHGTIHARMGITPSVLRGYKMLHEMRHVEPGELCATCELTAVCIDAQTRKPRSFPPEIAARAKEIP